MLFLIEGTTYSGNPVRTTLGNTMRSVFYSYFYAHKAGLFSVDNWINYRGKTTDDFTVWSIASGDDTVMWLHKKNIAKLRSVIDSLTTND
jgi:hypothetical protein